MAVKTLGLFEMQAKVLKVIKQRQQLVLYALLCGVK